MTKIIEIGARGRIVVYLDGNELKVSNQTSCVLIVDNKLCNLGETV